MQEVWLQTDASRRFQGHRPHEKFQLAPRRVEQGSGTMWPRAHSAIEVWSDFEGQGGEVVCGAGSSRGLREGSGRARSGNSDTAKVRWPTPVPPQTGTW